MRIRPLQKAYSDERSELASALAGFLKDTNPDPVPVPCVANRFLIGLQKREIGYGSVFKRPIALKKPVCAHEGRSSSLQRLQPGGA
jgi:hypothetical protein